MANTKPADAAPMELQAAQRCDETIHRHISLRAAMVALRLGLVVAATFMAGCIAWNSRPAAHPDEQMHMDAFRYFEAAWLRPRPGSDAVLYSSYGWSRVFTGEVVYQVYGKIGGFAKLLYSPPGGWSDTFKLKPYDQGSARDVYRLYRMINVALLAGTLVWLMFARCDWFPGWTLAVTMVAIPQCVYIYSYANSDAWGLSACMLLFLVSAQMAERHPRDWAWPRVVAWAFLLAAVLLSKVGFLAGIGLPLVVIVASAFSNWSVMPAPRWRWITARMILPMVVAYCAAAAYQPYIRPFSSYPAEVRSAGQMKASPEFRGEVPIHWGSNLAGKGFTTQRMLMETTWTQSNFTSFYSRFGGWDTEHAQWTFDCALVLLATGTALSVISRIVWSREWYDWLCMAFGPLVFVATLHGTLWHSLHIDFQPQGRYMFACMVPLAFWWCGGIAQTRPWWRVLQLLVVVLSITLSIYVLWAYGVANRLLNS